MILPDDPFILLSLINTQLRDKYPSLEALCDDTEANAGEIVSRLEAAGFFYDEKLNKFV